MKTRKPIRLSQMKTLVKRLEERGFDSQDFQEKMIDNIKGLFFFLNGGFSLKGDWLVKDDHGFILEQVEGAVLGATLVELYGKGHPYIRIGDTVFSKRGIFGKGKKGTVISIRRPYFCGSTTDIFLVDFNNGEKPGWVKFRDIRL